MSKQLITIGILAALSFTAAGEEHRMIAMVDGTYLNVGRSYTQKVGDTTVDTVDAVTTWGAAASGWLDVGGGVGVLGSMSLAFPTRLQRSTSSDGKKVGDHDEEVKYGGLALAGDVGGGWKLGAPDSPFAVILGGGLHADVVTVYSAEVHSVVDHLSSTVLGAYLQALPMFRVSDWAYLTAGLKLVYNFLLLERQPALTDRVDYSGGWTLGLSLGVGVGF